MSNEVMVRAALLSWVLEKDYINPTTGVTIPAGTRIFITPETTADAVLISQTETLGDLWGSLSKTGHTHSTATQSANGFLSSSDKLKIDGYGYGVCDTAAATAEKVVAANGFHLHDGSFLCVKFTQTNTAASPTLNVNGSGAKNIYFQGAVIESGWLVANVPYFFRYNGTQFEVVATDITIYQTQLASALANITRLQGRVATLEVRLTELISWCKAQGYEESIAS